MNRYDNFLSKNLQKYLNNDFIYEIVISDENGNDNKKIRENFKSNKLVLSENEYVLGPFLNKLKVCKLAKCEWIALMDSDNFADTNYFQIAQNYIQNVILDQKNIILAPEKANPNFIFSDMSGFILKNGNFNMNSNIDVLLNAGNFVINKYLIDNLDLKNEIDFINLNKASPYDVLYFNLLLFEQLDLNLHVVNNLEYYHCVHSGSTYLNNYQQFHICQKMITDRICKLEKY
jgi:hypothetical protein